MKLVIDGVALGLANLLQNHLLRSLRLNAAQNVGGTSLRNFSADFDGGLLLARFGKGDFAKRVGNFLDNRADGEEVNLTCFRVEFRTQILVGFIKLTRRDNHRFLNGCDDDLRLDMLLPADLLDCLE